MLAFSFSLSIPNGLFFFKELKENFSESKHESNCVFFAWNIKGKLDRKKGRRIIIYVSVVRNHQEKPETAKQVVVHFLQA